MAADNVFSEKSGETALATQDEGLVLPVHISDTAGRRSLVHDEALVREILDNIRAGCTQAIAVQAAGITPATYYNWKRRGEIEKVRIAQGFPPRDQEAPFLAFFEKLEQAEAQAEAGMVAEVRAEAGGGKWILPRRWPERWSQASRQAVEIQVSGARSTLDALPPEVRHHVEALLIARVGLPSGETNDEDVIDGDARNPNDDQ